MRAKHLESQMVGGTETSELAIKFISLNDIQICVKKKVFLGNAIIS